MNRDDWRQALTSPSVRYCLFGAAGFFAATAIIGRPEWSAALWNEKAAGWASAIGTIAAVIVALVGSTASMRWLQREKQEEGRRQEARRIAIASVVDHELYNIGSTVLEVIQKLGDRDVVAHNPRAAFNWTRLQITRESTPMMERFVGELDLFGTDDAVVLLTTYSGWLTVYAMLPDLTNVSTDDMPHNATISELGKFREVLSVLLDQIRRARTVTHAYNVRVRPDAPAALFGDGEEF